MSIYRQNLETQKVESVTSGRRGFIGKIRHFIAMAVFCLMLGSATVCMAYTETPGTVLAESANIRSTSDTTGTVLASVKKNQTVSICGETTGADGKVWYQVYVNATTKGYIRSDLVQKSGASETTTTTATNTTATNTATTTTTTTELPATNATAVERKNATVSTNNVRIRKGASTQHGVVATANRGMVVTVTGEATGSDNKLWYQIAFTYNSKEITGFIRSDLVTFETVTQEPIVSEIEGSEAGETAVENTTEVATEPQTEPIAEEEPPVQVDEYAGIILKNSNEEISYVMPGFKEVILEWEGQEIKAYKNGDANSKGFFIFYAQKQNGEEGWFLFDAEKGSYQRYAYDVSGVTAEEEKGIGSTLPIFVLVVVIAVLLVIIGLMYMRIREYTMDEYDEDDDDDDDDDDGNDDEEVEVRKPSQQPQRVSQGQPVRREMNRIERTEPTNPVRRPADRPVRKMDNVNSARRENDRPVRRADATVPTRRTPEGQPMRNMEGRRPDGSMASRRQAPRPTQNRPVRNPQPQNGYRAKNFLEAGEDDDMEFIEL